MFEGGPGSDAAAFETAARGAGVIVVAGGDGSVHHAAVVAMKVDVPIYHLPCGNENLFAREFGMTRSVHRLGEMIERGEQVAVDVGRLSGPGPSGETCKDHFLLMASFGPDASVVRRLAESRKRATGHLAYVMPVLAEFLRPHLPKVSVWVDGQKLVDNRRGMLVVANCRRYALGIDPCHEASMTDGVLDVLFMPCEGRWGVLRMGARCGLRAAGRAGAVSAQGHQVRVVGAEVVQLDGEAVSYDVKLAPDVQMGVHCQSLRVVHWA